MEILFQNVTLRRGKKILFESASFRLKNKSKVGIIGENGCGKSSLFKLILKELENDIGDVQISKNNIISHVAQEAPTSSQSAIDYVINGDKEFRYIENEILKAEQNNQLDKLHKLYELLENIEGYTVKTRASKLLNGLGFLPEQEQLSVSSFSGGWKMRLNLAQALMCRSDLLLLDEPTNHLDLEAIIWLEEWLKKYQGIVLLISHDRDFLNSVSQQILSIENQEITTYSGNFDQYEKFKVEKLRLQQSQFESQQKKMAHMQKYIDRFRYKASKAKQAQSRIKALEKMDIISMAQSDSPFDFEFKNHAFIPEQLLKIEKANVGYDDENILSEIDFFLHKGEKIGLLGFNGAGKSTFIKLIAKDLTAKSGIVNYAKGLKIGYFAQHQLDQLHLDQSPIRHLKDLDSEISEQQARNFLGGFAFHGDMVTGSIEYFSGGEKARLVLALIVYQQPNVLLLDEPTNHLDMKMRHAISVAIQSFEGAMILVSHDRHLLSTVCEKLYYIYAGQIKPFDGDLQDYYSWANKVRTQRLEPDNSKAKPANNKKNQRQEAAKIRQDQKPIRQKIRQIEKEMSKIQKEIEKNEQLLLDESIYKEENSDKLLLINKNQPLLKSQVSELEEQWLLLSEELE